MDYIDVFMSLIILIILEIVLGIDNLVILSILSEKLPFEQRKKARRLGLMIAWIARLGLLFLAVDLTRLTEPLFKMGHYSFSPRDLLLILGGGFLIWKATNEIHKDVTEGSLFTKKPQKTYKASFKTVIIQIVLMDIIFSLDSVLTALGLTPHLVVMAFAITCAILIMISASEVVSAFIKKNPPIQILALSYLILIGVALVADGFSTRIPRGYLYFAMGFSISVEALNLLKASYQKRKKI